MSRLPTPPLAFERKGVYYAVGPFRRLPCRKEEDMGELPDGALGPNDLRSFLFRDDARLGALLTQTQRRKTPLYCYGCNRVIAPSAPGYRIEGYDFHERIPCVVRGVRRTPKSFSSGLVTAITSITQIPADR
jgi:hypothetical protein